MKLRWSVISMIGFALAAFVLVGAFLTLEQSPRANGVIQTLGFNQASNAGEIPEGSYTGSVKLVRVGAGVYTDTLPTATPVPNVTPVPTPDMGRVEMAFFLRQTGNAVSGYVDLGTTLVFTKEATILVTPVGTPSGPGTPVPTPAPLDIGPAVNGTFDGTTLDLRSDVVSQVIAGQPVQRQFHIVGTLREEAQSITLSGEYSETVWGFAPQPLTLVGTFELSQPVFAADLPPTGTPTVTPTTSDGTSTPTATATTPANSTSTPTVTATAPANSTSTPTATATTAGVSTSTPTATATTPANSTSTSTPTATATVPSTGVTVTGLVYNDRNGNGNQDGDEPGVAGAEVTLTSTNRDIDITRTAITNVGGVYTLNDVPVGQYTLEVKLPPGQSGANPPPVSVNVTGTGPVNVPSVAVTLLRNLYLPSVQR